MTIVFLFCSRGTYSLSARWTFKKYENQDLHSKFHLTLNYFISYLPIPIILFFSTISHFFLDAFNSKWQLHSRFFTHQVNISSGQIVRVATSLARARSTLNIDFSTPIMWHGRVNICHDWPPMVPVSPVLLDIPMVGGLFGELLSCVYTSHLHFQIYTTGFDLVALPLLFSGLFASTVMLSLFLSLNLSFSTSLSTTSLQHRLRVRMGCQLTWWLSVSPSSLNLIIKTSSSSSYHDSQPDHSPVHLMTQNG